MISLFRVEVDEVLQRLLAYCTEFRRFVDAHTAVLHTAVNAGQEFTIGSAFSDYIEAEIWADPGGSLQITAGDRKSTRLNSSHSGESRMPSSA